MLQGEVKKIATILRRNKLHSDAVPMQYPYPKQGQLWTLAHYVVSRPQNRVRQYQHHAACADVCVTLVEIHCRPLRALEGHYLHKHMSAANIYHMPQV